MLLSNAEVLQSHAHILTTVPQSAAVIGSILRLQSLQRRVFLPTDQAKALVQKESNNYELLTQTPGFACHSNKERESLSSQCTSSFF